MKSSLFIDSTTKNTYTLRTLFRLTDVIILWEIDNIQKKKSWYITQQFISKSCILQKRHFFTFAWLWNTSISFCSVF